MPLPSIPVAQFEGTFPNSKTKFKYRPFNTAEQKALLIAQTSNNKSVILNNIINLVNECTFNKYDFGTVKLSWLEYALLCIRSVSVNELLEVSVRCRHEVDEKECGHVNEISIPYLEQAKFTKPIDKVITIVDEFKLVMKDVNTNDVLSLIDSPKEYIDVNDNLEFFYDKVDYVMRGDDIFNDFTLDEFKEFVHTMPVGSVERVNQFVNNFEHATLPFSVTCGKCKSKTDIEIEGAINFFSFSLDTKP